MWDDLLAVVDFHKALSLPPSREKIKLDKVEERSDITRLSVFPARNHFNAAIDSYRHKYIYREWACSTQGNISEQTNT